MMNFKKFDVIIIGSGIGGLIAGCYLSKYGLKVLIAEQHNRPGGYCSSFRRKRYLFDVGVHFLGSMRIGVLGKILKEIGVFDRTKFLQYDPTDKIIMPDFCVSIRSNFKETIEEFIKVFPNEEKGIRRFFAFICCGNLAKRLISIKDLNFKEFMDIYFSDVRLQATFNVLLSNIGLNCFKLSAVAGMLLMRGYIFDSGYYPVGGMQNFSNTIADKFKEYGGELLLSTKVERILTKNKRVVGALVGNETFSSEHVVSNCDARATFLQLLDVEAREIEKIESLECSTSIFAAYLGLAGIKAEKILIGKSNVWRCFTYDMRKQIDVTAENVLKADFPIVMFSSTSLHNENSSKENLSVFTLAPYVSREFWSREKNRMGKKLLEITKLLFNVGDSNLKMIDSASPATFERYTNNYRGSAYGWSPLASKSYGAAIPQKTSIKNLFLAGHWIKTNIWHGGIPGVAFTGRNAAELILKSYNNKFSFQD